jgi:hypothetical protein
MTEEAFWRDVASRTVSALMILFGGVVWAATAGWLNPSVPVVAARWGALAIGVLLAGITLLGVLAVVATAREMQRRERAGRKYAIAMSLLVGAMIALVAVPYAVGLARGTMFGTSL